MQKWKSKAQLQAHGRGAGDPPSCEEVSHDVFHWDSVLRQLARLPSFCVISIATTMVSAFDLLPSSGGLEIYV